MAGQGHGLAALGTLRAPSRAKDLVQFEESLIDHLLRFSAALEAEADKLADSLGRLEEGVAGAEQGMARIDEELSRMHAAGQVRVGARVRPPCLMLGTAPRRRRNLQNVLLAPPSGTAPCDISTRTSCHMQLYTLSSRAWPLAPRT